MMVVDCVKSFDFNGKVAEKALDEVSITCNKQVIPDDPNPPLRPSGIRLGTPAATTRGFGDPEMKQLASWILRTLSNPEDESALTEIKSEVEDLCARFPVPGIAN
jgi:glycine hydroxymethyltransferase